ncbi:MAG: ABC-2 transporter permease [Eubacteriales bacterium]|nr:ABC-2 transporter permease [Eubacteriales bacterium]
MKNLLYKEFKLAKHPTMFLFLAFALMLLIPSYPYYVAFIYTCLAVFFVFLTGRETKDVVFTALLPVAKGDIVRARCVLVVLMELAQVLISVPFAILSVRINPNGCNPAGIEANVAFFGLVLGMYALFNLLFFPIFYRTAYNAGRALLISGLAVMLYIVVAEGLVLAVPLINAYLDTTAASAQLRQLPVLAAGGGLYVLATWAACRKSVRLFEKVDL